MKLFVSKKKYDLISNEYLKLSNDYEELREEYKNSIEISKNNFLRATELESENEKLLLNEASFNNEIITLNQEIRLYERTVKLYEKTVKELEKEIDNLKKGNKALSEMWNDANRKLWCNQESARQLRKLSEDILSSQRLDKNYIASYIRNISAYVGGGVGVEVKPKEGKENE